MLQTGDAVEHPHLDVLGHGGREALDVQFFRIQPHGFHEELVALFVGEPDDLGLDGRAVPGAGRLNGAIIQRGAIQICSNHRVGLLVGVGQIADRLIFRRFFRGEREGNRFRIALLQLHLGEIHAAGVDAWRRAGLEPADGDAQLFQAAGQLQRRLEPVGAGVSEHVAYDGASP